MKILTRQIFIVIIANVILYSGCSQLGHSQKKLLPMPQFKEENVLVAFRDNEEDFKLQPEAFEAWIRMRNSAKSSDMDLQIVSAFRSVKRQAEIVESKRQRGLSDADIFKVNARPGYSEHHTGKAIDLTTPGFAVLEREFENSKAYKWLTENADKFGFYLSYPKDNKYGIIYEPWHWCFKNSDSAD